MAAKLIVFALLALVAAAYAGYDAENAFLDALKEVNETSANYARIVNTMMNRPDLASIFKIPASVDAADADFASGIVAVMIYGAGMVPPINPEEVASNPNAGLEHLFNNLIAEPCTELTSKLGELATHVGPADNVWDNTKNWVLTIKTCNKVLENRQHWIDSAVAIAQENHMF